MSRSLSELTRQITPPTKNGHGPPKSVAQAQIATRGILEKGEVDGPKAIQADIRAWSDICHERSG